MRLLAAEKTQLLPLTFSHKLTTLQVAVKGKKTTANFSLFFRLIYRRLTEWCAYGETFSNGLLICKLFSRTEEQQ